VTEFSTLFFKAPLSERTECFLLEALPYSLFERRTTQRCICITISRFFSDTLDVTLSLLQAYISTVEPAFNSDLQGYADGRLSAARTTHTEQISKDLPNENFGCPGLGLGRRTDNHIPIKTEIYNPQTTSAGRNLLR
jgi:hypothetical protein